MVRCGLGVRRGSDIGRCNRPRRERGVVLLALLLVMAIGGVALMAAADVAQLTRQREKEQELLFAGDQYRQAIQRYYFAAPAGARHVLPSRLEDLLEDDRFPIPVRHLRRLYPDPMTASTEWGLVRNGDRISGVYSLSEKKPVKQTGFADIYQHFNRKTSYRDWVFAVSAAGRRGTLSVPPSGTPGAPPAPPPTAPRPFGRSGS